MCFMRKSFILFILFCGCSGRVGIDTAALPSEQLIALSGNDLSGLTRGDKERLNKYPDTLKKIDHAKPLTIQDIKNLTRSGVSDRAIIALIHQTRSTFYLTAEDEQELMQAGISNKVIEDMKSTASGRY